MIDEIERTIRDRWPHLRLPGSRPGRLQLHLDSRDPRPHGFVTFRAFRSGDATPLCVGRIPRDGIGARDALHEHDLLESIEQEAPRVAGRLYPRPLFVLDRGMRVATACSMLPGERVADRLGRTAHRGSRVDEALRLGGRWLSAFGRATGLLEGTEGALWEPFLRSIHFEVRSVPEERRPLLEELVAAIEERRGHVTLCGYGHGALATASVRVAGDRIGVEEWEHGRARQAPWADPIHYAWVVALRELDTAADAARSLSEPDHAIGRFVRERLDDTGVPAGVLPLAIPAVALAAAHRADRNGPVEPTGAAWREAALAAALASMRPASTIRS